MVLVFMSSAVFKALNSTVFATCSVQNPHIEGWANQRRLGTCLLHLLDYTSSVLSVCKLAEQDLLLIDGLNINELQQAVSVILR